LCNWKNRDKYRYARKNIVISSHAKKRVSKLFRTAETFKTYARGNLLASLCNSRISARTKNIYRDELILFDEWRLLSILLITPREFRHNDPISITRNRNGFFVFRFYRKIAFRCFIGTPRRNMCTAFRRMLDRATRSRLVREIARENTANAIFRYSLRVATTTTTILPTGFTIGTSTTRTAKSFV